MSGEGIDFRFGVSVQLSELSVGSPGRITPQKDSTHESASPRLASPRLASPRLASPRLASPRLASVKLSAEQLEARDVPAIILTETTTITTVFGQTANLTVTVDDIGGEYHWNYHLANSTVNYADPGDPEQGIGIFRIQTAPASVDVSTLGSTSGWSVYVGDTSENNGLVQWAVDLWGTRLLTGQSFNFWFETEPVDIVDAATEFADAGYATPAGGPAKAPGNEPTLQLLIEGQSYNGQNEPSPTKKIRINDNFDDNQVTADGQFIYSDLVNDPITQAPKLNVADLDIVAGMVNLESEARNWTLKIDGGDRVRMWYMEWRGPNEGTYQVLPENGTLAGTNEAVPEFVALLIEGRKIYNRSLPQTFHINAELKVNNAALTVADYARVQVYSGLGVTGNVNQAMLQLEAATAWKLVTVDGAMWRNWARTAAHATDAPTAWQLDARTIFTTIFEAEKTTLVKGVLNSGTVFFDRFATTELDGTFIPAQIDVGDLQIAFDFLDRSGAALLASSWYRQYLWQVEEVYDENEVNTIAWQKEALILVGSGTRTPSHTNGVGTQSWTYSYEGNVTITFDFNLTTGAITNFFKRNN